MGELWFGSRTRNLLQRDFTCILSAKAVRCFVDQFSFVAETLGDAGGDSASRAKPIENNLPFFTNCSGYSLHRLDIVPHRLGVVFVQELAGPGWAVMLPER